MSLILDEWKTKNQVELTRAQEQSFDAVMLHQGSSPLNISYSFLLGVLFMHYSYILIGIEKDGYAHS